MKLRQKYAVTKIDDGTQLPNSVDVSSTEAPFVIIPGKDPAAYKAAYMYSLYCEPELGEEIRVWLGKIMKAGMKLGTQGQRNAPYALIDPNDLEAPE